MEIHENKHKFFVVILNEGIMSSSNELRQDESLNWLHVRKMRCKIVQACY